MNRQGHSKTLVAAHPGNRNAVKEGVFSPATLAPRVNQAQRIIEQQAPDEVLADVLRREIAGLKVLGEAMDGSLQSRGTVGRNGQPRTLISLRLRLNEKLRRTLQEYAEVCARMAQVLTVPGEHREPLDEARSVQVPLADSIAGHHFRASISELRPEEVDPEAYLAAVVINEGVPLKQRLRARRLLTSRKRRRSSHCVCFSTLTARDEIELRLWVNEARAVTQQHEEDPWLASLVRAVTRGEQLEPWPAYRFTIGAVQAAVAEGARRARPDQTERDVRDRTEQSVPTVRPFWKILLSDDAMVSASERLQAFEALEDVGAFPECNCREERGDALEEVRYDALRAYYIRLVAGRSYRGALVRAQFQETYFAIREAIDLAILEEWSGADEAVEGAQPRASTEGPAA
jgi:hypothetical protein